MNQKPETPEPKVYQIRPLTWTTQETGNPFGMSRPGPVFLAKTPMGYLYAWEKGWKLTSGYYGWSNDPSTDQVGSLYNSGEAQNSEDAKKKAEEHYVQNLEKFLIRDLRSNDLTEPTRGGQDLDPKDFPKRTETPEQVEHKLPVQVQENIDRKQHAKNIIHNANLLTILQCRQQTLEAVLNPVNERAGYVTLSLTHHCIMMPILTNSPEHTYRALEETEHALTCAIRGIVRREIEAINRRIDLITREPFKDHEPKKGPELKK